MVSEKEAAGGGKEASNVDLTKGAGCLKTSTSLIKVTGISKQGQYQSSYLDIGIERGVNNVKVGNTRQLNLTILITVCSKCEKATTRKRKRYFALQLNRQAQCTS